MNSEGGKEPHHRITEGCSTEEEKPRYRVARPGVGVEPAAPATNHKPVTFV